MSDLILIPGGEFVMGDDEGQYDERPPHLTSLDPFSIGRHPVTNAEYAEFVNDTGSPPPAVRALPAIVESATENEFRKLAELHQWINGSPPPGRERHPVTLVTHSEAVAYCNWLSRRTDRLIRLPSEAEWEKAARGGLEANRFPWGNEIDESKANYLPDGSVKHERNTSAVGSHPPNKFGLYDMAGNVWEWVSDWYAADYYSRTPYANPRGPEDGTMRLVRGGAWVSAAGYLRCGCRHNLPQDSYAYSIGFRIACSE